MLLASPDQTWDTVCRALLLAVACHLVCAWGSSLFLVPGVLMWAAFVFGQALKTDVNALPLHFVLSWFEQKAVAVLLSLLHLGVKDIHIGPALPAFVTPNVLKVLVDNYGLTAIGSVEDDLKKFLSKAQKPSADGPVMA